jgi:hypothetical protein
LLLPADPFRLFEVHPSPSDQVEYDPDLELSVSYDPYGQQPPSFYPPPAPAQRPARWAWAVLAAAIVLFAGVGWWVYDNHIRTDSGLAACKTVRDGGKLQGAGNGGATMTEADYRDARKIFQDSRYDDIRSSGTKLMDVAWQVSQLGPDPGFEALPYLGQITSAVTDFQGACANHGVIVNLKLNATPTPTQTS